jgi:hypothetical protein
MRAAAAALIRLSGVAFAAALVAAPAGLAHRLEPETRGGGRRIFGTRRGRVRFVGVADRGLLANRRQLRRYLRRAGL